MKYEKSVITMTLHWHNSQVFSFGNCIDDTPTETDIINHVARLPNSPLLIFKTFFMIIKIPTAYVRASGISGQVSRGKSKE